MEPPTDDALRSAAAHAWTAQEEWEASLVGSDVRYDDATRLRAVCQRVCLLLADTGLQVPEGARWFPPSVQFAVSEGRPTWAYSPGK